MTAADWIRNLHLRSALIERFTRCMDSFDAMIAPTTAITAPPISDMEDDDKFRRANRLLLRNPMVANLLDAPSISIPCHAEGSAPAGLMLTAAPMRDRRLLSIAGLIENLLAGGRPRSM